MPARTCWYTFRPLVLAFPLILTVVHREIGRLPHGTRHNEDMHRVDMDITEIERRIAVARDRVATLQHRAGASSIGHQQFLLDTLRELQGSMDDLNVAMEELDVAMEQMRLQNAALTAAEKRLARMNAELERQVLERTAQIEAASRLKDELLHRERAARNAAEAAQERLALVAAASSVLSRVLDPDSALERVAALALPLLGDWCFVDVLDDDNATNRRVAVAHTDPTQDPIARELRALAPSAELHAWDAGRTAANPQRSELVSNVDDDAIRHAFPDDAHRRAVAALHPVSWMRVPLVARGTVRGLVTMIGTRPGRRFSADDLTLAEDLVRRGAAAVEQARLFRQAQEANQTKSGFLASMSHELRTPLNAIIGYTELLQLGIPESLPKEAGRQVDRIRAASQHLLSLIEEILTFSRIEAGSEHLYTEPLLPMDIANDAASLVEPMATAKGLRFTVDVPAELPVLETDPGKLRQVLVNLLSNAVKFTERGEVALTARAHEGGVVFVVRDTGIGIATEHQERVFEAFWQIRYPAMHHAGGTGLGLSVSRQLARMLGGDLTVESEPSRGSAFSLWLPARERTASARAQEAMMARADEPASAGEASPSGPVQTPPRSERVGDLPHGRPRPHRGEDERHELGA